jgi:hypothetical protein
MFEFMLASRPPPATFLPWPLLPWHDWNVQCVNKPEAEQQHEVGLGLRMLPILGISVVVILFAEPEPRHRAGAAAAFEVKAACLNEGRT